MTKAGRGQNSPYSCLYDKYHLDWKNVSKLTSWIRWLRVEVLKTDTLTFESSVCLLHETQQLVYVSLNFLVYKLNEKISEPLY